MDANAPIMPATIMTSTRVVPASPRALRGRERNRAFIGPSKVEGTSSGYFSARTPTPLEGNGAPIATNFDEGQVAVTVPE